jgi:hypothetical protein
MKSTPLIALSAAAIVATAVGIGAAQHAFTDSAPAAPSTIDQTDSARIQDRADEIYRSFAGTRFERDAGAVLATHAANAPAMDCMTAHGVPGADWSMPRPQNPDVHGLDTSIFFNNPDATPYTDMLMATAGAARADLEASAESTLTDEQLKTADECLKTTPETPDKNAAPSPDGVIPLLEQWWAMVNKLDTSLGDPDTYWTCLAKQDVNGARGIDSKNAALDQLQTRTPPADQLPDSPTSKAATTPAWQQLVAFEKDLRAAELTCRTDTYTHGLAKVEDAIEQFAKDHADDIKHARNGWEAYADQARALGYTGAYESLVR